MQDLRFIRQTELGVYNEDDCQGVHPDVIQEYHGTTWTQVHRSADQTGAGHPPEEYDDSLMGPLPELIGEVAEDQGPNIRHDAIPTADHGPPLIAPECLELFSDAVAVLRCHNDDDLLRSIAGQVIIWDPVEVIKVGHRQQKELVISLEDVAWERRALLWFAALHLLDHLL